MGIPVLIIGKSGSGKSTSLRNFEPEEIGLINVSRKPLPFRKKFISTLMTDNYAEIEKAMSETAKKTIVIDDAGYLITNMFMSGHSKTGGGNAIFAFYNKVADSFWRLIESIKSLPEDRIVYVIMHEDKNDSGDIKPKTIGKLLDEKVDVPGMFTICLKALRGKDGYFFKTQSENEFEPFKSPFGMFSELIIPNDLKAVDTAIREYYGITGGN